MKFSGNFIRVNLLEKFEKNIYKKGKLEMEKETIKLSIKYDEIFKFLLSIVFLIKLLILISLYVDFVSFLQKCDYNILSWRI